MLENLMTKGQMADIFVNGGLAMSFVLKGDVKVRNLYVDFRRFDEFETAGVISKQAIDDFIEVLRQYYTQFFSNTSKFMKMEGVPDSLLKRVIRELPVDKSGLIEESLEDLPLCYGLMQLDIEDLEEDIRLAKEVGIRNDYIEKGKRIISENSLPGFTGFILEEDSLLGSLARDAVRAAYKQLF